MLESGLHNVRFTDSASIRSTDCALCSFYPHVPASCQRPNRHSSFTSISPQHQSRSLPPYKSHRSRISSSPQNQSKKPLTHIPKSAPHTNHYQVYRSQQSDTRHRQNGRPHFKTRLSQAGDFPEMQPASQPHAPLLFPPSQRSTTHSLIQRKIGRHD